jgi:hypothetical protein
MQRTYLEDVQNVPQIGSVEMYTDYNPKHRMSNSLTQVTCQLHAQFALPLFKELQAR